MAGRVRFVCLLHSHQPVGNFDHVIEEAYQKSYLRYVEVFSQFPRIPLTNHFSGCLLEWLEQKRPEYFDLLRRSMDPGSITVFGKEGRGAKPWEMVGGGFYEPIMTMLPSRDRQGQISMMSDYLESTFGAKPRGCWLTERVWEPALVKDLAQSGVEYLTLDDNHFRAAGLRDEELTGSYITEDEGHTVRVYPASERLRYIIPYAQVHEIIGYLRSLVPPEGERVVCYADDGEKFGVWPNTFKHVYEDGWLRNFLSALDQAQNEGWLECCTLSEATDALLPVGRVYLPENSYREMTEWALPAKTLSAYEHAVNAVNDDPRVKDILPLVKGGNWRSFRVKYEEGGRMYGKMMEVSAKVAELSPKAKLSEKSKQHLYRGQCNCPYWHGVFGGMYLPHLRSAIYRELIHAEKLADELRDSAVACEAHDFDFDGQDEIKLANEHAALYFHPSRGGHLYEFDLRDAAFNVGDTFSRRYEAYHDKVARAVVGTHENAKSIHDMVLAKEAGLTDLLKYDAYLRESLVDHLSHERLTTDHFLSGHPPSDAGFRQGMYESRLEPESPKSKKRAKQLDKAGMNPERAVLMTRAGSWNGRDIEIRKRISMKERPSFLVEYLIENKHPEEMTAHFAVEMNYSLLAGDAHDRYYYLESAENAGRLGMIKDLGVQPLIGLKDHWLNVALTLKASTPAHVLVCPVKTVSQSEGGFESVYQSSCVVLQWTLKIGPWQSFKVDLTQEVGKAH